MARPATLRFTPPAHEPVLSRDKRHARGVYYTPPQIVRLMADLALNPLLADQKRDKPPRVLDPACGAGEFLVEAYQRVADRYGANEAASAVCGIDVDASGIKTARARLRGPGMSAEQVRRSVRCADALDEATLQPALFDCILANPPYLSIRQLAKSLPRERIDELRGRFRTARGNFDLYVLFIERAIELLRPGGRCAIIIPNKWATLDYARPCRELLLKETTLEQVIDLSANRVFAGASVYPHVLVFRNEPPAATHQVQVAGTLRVPSGGTRSVPTTLPQRLLSPIAVSLDSPLDVESRVQTAPLEKLCTLSCGTAGYAAQRIAARLCESGDVRGSDRRAADFITSGNIDRYAIALGNVRYLRRTYTRPQLPLDAPELTERKRRLFREPKIVIAGMSQRLEAAWDDDGLALGVQVFAASDFHVDPFYLLALLNSKLLSFLFRSRYGAKRLAGDYLAINKGQLAQLPIAVAAESRLAELGQVMSRQPSAAVDARIDRLVYRLYHLSAAEIARVEQSLAESATRAA